MSSKASTPIATARRQPVSAPTPVQQDVTEQIRRRAYQIYEERGRSDGYAEQDWLQAEAEILANQKGTAAA